MRWSRPCVESWLFQLLRLLTAVPFLVILVKLRARTRWKGLVLAACWGGGVSLAVLILVLPETALNRTLWALFLLIGLAHALLFVAAVKALYSMPAEAHARCDLVLALLGTPFLMLLAMAGLADRNRPPHKRAYLNEISAISTLKKIRTASESYATAFSNGYPSSLMVLGPADEKGPGCARAGLVDERQARGEWASYTFEHHPGPVIGRPATACPPGVQDYSVSARPREFERSGCRSFFLDVEGRIHYTYQNRAATRDDPKLEF